MVLLLSKCCGKNAFGNDMFYIFTKFIDGAILVKDLVAKFQILKVL